MAIKERSRTLSDDSGTGGELFSMLLRLHPVESGHIFPGAGNQIQAAFLEMIRQADPTQADYLHTANQRRPYTLSLLQGFNHLTSEQIAEAMHTQKALAVHPGQVYWLRVTILDAKIIGTLLQCLIAQARALTLRIGDARFEISRLLTVPEPESTGISWIAFSSFATLHNLIPTQQHYRFEFASPTTFSKGQRPWGKLLKLFPEPAYVFDSLARQWENFAPGELRLSALHMTPGEIALWCEDNMLVSHYTLETHYLPSNKFGQTGFQGVVTYEVKGKPTAPQASWLTPLAKFALFSGIGYKTAMGMGQARCINIADPQIGPEIVQETAR